MDGLDLTKDGLSGGMQGWIVIYDRVPAPPSCARAVCKTPIARFFFYDSAWRGR